MAIRKGSGPLVFWESLLGLWAPLVHAGLGGPLGELPSGWLGTLFLAWLHFGKWLSPQVNVQVGLTGLVAGWRPLTGWAEGDRWLERVFPSGQISSRNISGGNPFFLSGPALVVFVLGS